MHRIPWLAALVAVAIATLPADGIAQEADSEKQRRDRSELTVDQKRRLKRLIEEARGAYESEKYERAVEKLREAHELYPNPAFFYRIGLAEAHAGDTDAAIESFERYLEAKPDSPKREEVERRLASLRDERSSKEDETSADAKATEQKASREAGSEADGETSKTGASAPASESDDDRGGGGRTFGYVLGGVGAAAAISSGTFAYLFFQSDDRLDEFRATHRRSPENEARERELIDERNRRLIVTYASGGLAVAALGSAAFLLLRDDSSEKKRTSSRDARSGFAVGVHPRDDGFSIRIATPF